MSLTSDNFPPEFPPTAKVREWQEGLKIVDRFRLQRLLGRGGQGTVWLAEDELLQTPVALKRFAPHFSWLAPTEIERIRREVVRVRAISHPGVVRLHDLLALPDGLVLVMEWIDGESVADLIRREGPLTPDQILTWLPGLCEALDHVHAVGKLVHRDLKPGNVLLDRDGRAHLCDFGIAAPLAESLARMSGLSLPGTLAYMSPQQLFGADPAPSDDLYSLGALLYECLCGEPPFTQGHLPAQIERLIPEKLSTRRHRKNLKPAPWEKHCDRLLQRCLDKSPEARPQSAKQLLALADGRETLRPSLRRWRQIGMITIAVVGLTMIAWRSASPLRSHLSLAPTSPASATPPNWRDYRREPARYWSGVIADTLVLHAPLGSQWIDTSGFGHRPTYLAGSATDPWGHANEAVAFDGRTRWQVPAHPVFALGSDDPWTLAIWLRVDSLNGSLFQLTPADPASLGLELALQDGRPRLDWHSTRLGDRACFLADATLTPNRWHHLVVQRGPDDLRIEVDGEAAGAFRLDSLPTIPAGAEATLSFGRTATQRSGPQLTFALDELHFWRAELSTDAKRSVFLRDPTHSPADPRAFFRTARRYRILEEGTDDLAVLHQRMSDTFGQDSAVAAWEDLKRDFDQFGDLFAMLHGGADRGSWHVTYRGDATFSTGRLMRLQRRASDISPQYLAQDEFFDRSFVLGSWLTVNGAIVTLPDADVAVASTYLSSEPGMSDWPAGTEVTDQTWPLLHSGKSLAIGVGLQPLKPSQSDELTLSWQPSHATQAALECRISQGPNRSEDYALSIREHGREVAQRRFLMDTTRHTLWLVIRGDRLVLVLAKVGSFARTLEVEITLSRAVPRGETVMRWNAEGDSLRPQWIEAGSL
ncbi:protein kinase domain-containing protein [Actomonas aquatica]|uniref:Protein kinase n=1 Tax=Actomonas aquatica TaxID=2866162 RepID=A0ABZ1C325_9BACT|nr:protein kinase [Opitutus sp. WL0086]WRQ85727.1 protein kinase [Opitutus sp. WL0086]